MKRLLPALLAAALLSGCDTAPVRHPKTTQECTLAVGVKAPDITLPVESSVVVRLPPAPAGLMWLITSNNNKVLEQMGPLGPGAAPEVSFYAKRPGRSPLRFALVQPGQAEAVPVAQCEVVVRVPTLD
jgi:hypothetical protein